ncbi:MAG: hypothetical protein K2P23_04215 [Lachnospiraceae bacterium]|nr:hypothetical protein [Lachnospiraceae bacterium]
MEKSIIKNFTSKILRLLKKTPVYELKDVFTPTSSANISYISRTSVEKKLKKALDIPGKQIVIYGHSGSGKTTILNHIVKEQCLKTITSRCTNNSTIDTIILDAFDSLNQYYTESTNISHKESLTGSITSEYLGIKSSITGTLENNVGEIQKRVLPPQLTIQRLCDFIGSTKALWIIEDFHKIPESEKSKISQMMKLFMDKAVDYPNSKIIVLGAANNGYEVVQHDTELNNRVSEIEVPLLTTAEIVKIVEKGATALNISISTETATEIAKYANCLATIAHQLAYNLCFNNNISKTQRKSVIIPNSELDQAVKDFTSEKQDTYKKLYMKITQQREGKYQNVSIILSTLCEMNDNVTQHALLTKIQENFPSYPPSNLSTYLKQLYSPEREEVLRNNAGRISFSEPFFKSYIRMLNVQQP